MNRTITHENYTSKKVDWDISLLKMSQNLTLNLTNAKSIPLPTPNKDPRGNLFVSGWGAMHENDHVLPDKLRVVDVPIVDRSKCNKTYLGEISIRMICA